MPKTTITIRGKSYNMDDLQDAVSIQKALVPDNWPLEKSAGVKLFLSLQNMLALQLKRHLAANFKRILRNAFEEAEDEGGKAAQAVSFTFEIDVTAPQVAAITKLKMAGSSKFLTTGKPVTHDLTQGEFLDENLGVVLDVKGFAEEQATPPEEEKPEEKDPAAGADVTAENTPGDAPKPKRGKKGAA